ncbi:hypothetical protein MSG28_006124 [Choristoneura fumiferana]|uniref:Uncharacterized protein n=1 Tax=Choristoneura fumiferana TaxID=7141 RepID=A0ACC0JDP3_CHOFU|nr:hypothetical protein MSG28_006124 [Choristoneura fumiferana]
MDNRIQNNPGILAPVASTAVENRTNNMYILQVKPNDAEGPLEAEAIPLHMLINEQDAENEQYLISVLQAKPLQLFIDQRGQVVTNTNGQYYEIPTPESQNSSDFTNSLRILNTFGTAPEPLKRDVDQTNDVVPENSLADVTMQSSDQDIVYKNADKKAYTSDRKVMQRFVHIKDRVVPPRAVAVLPPALQLRRGVVSPRRPLPARARFGPLEGISRTVSPAELQDLHLESTRSNLPLFLLKTDDDQTVYIDVSDKDKSNWLSLLPLSHTAANLWLYQDGGGLYAAAARPLPARAPLALGYSQEYAAAHGLPPGEPGFSILAGGVDLSAELAAPHRQRQWWCHECQRSMSTAALLQRHIDVHHTEERQRRQQRYRCQHCTRTFCRMFTLRRHIARHCTKKVKEEVANEASESVTEILNSSKSDELPELTLNSAHADDSRLPSDESLQTSLLTNNLDFSTNLFDDRMPNLDISGSSKSDNEFNPYSLGFKDDIGLVNASIDFEIEADACNSKENKTENEDSLLLTCRYCNQTVIRGRQRQHVRNCEGRKFQCGCGRAFLYKEKLALHIRFDHAGVEYGDTQQRLDGTKESDDLQYKCETCEHTFKRRGMLVNHLWRVHKNVSTAVPLERRVRHYPCGACPKMYRAAAKRDRHCGPGTTRAAPAPRCTAPPPSATATCAPTTPVSSTARPSAAPALPVRRLPQDVPRRRQARPPRAHPPPRSVALPALVRPRHYPCGACPKMYRAAAKRDRHVRTHHPVSSTARPSAPRHYPCGACPKMYRAAAKRDRHCGPGTTRAAPAPRCTAPPPSATATCAPTTPVSSTARPSAAPALPVRRLPQDVPRRRQARPPRAHPPPRSVALPALVRPRHYPCGSCPKMYRAAAKRDRHVRTHHPGQ